MSRADQLDAAIARAQTHCDTLSRLAHVLTYVERVTLHAQIEVELALIRRLALPMTLPFPRAVQS